MSRKPSLYTLITDSTGADGVHATRIYDDLTAETLHKTIAQALADDPALTADSITVIRGVRVSVTVDREPTVRVGAARERKKKVDGEVKRARKKKVAPSPLALPPSTGGGAA